MLALTPIEETGLPPYQVKGDPIVALLAQLNRFAGKSVSIGTCRDMRVVSDSFSLKRFEWQNIDERAATSAVVIVNQRYACIPALAISATREARWARSGYNDPVGFVTTNLNQVTLLVAQVGDAAGLSAADVGITEVDPRLKKTPTWLIVTGIGVGLLGIGALFARFAPKRKRLTA